MKRLGRFWEALWFSPASPRGMIAVRAIVCVYTFWLLLSRPALPRFLEWPVEFWSRMPRGMAARYGIGWLPLPIELALYLVLHLLIVMVMFGLFARAAAFAAAMLLYHFAPFAEILSGLYSHGTEGFAFSVLSLLVLAFAENPRMDDELSAEYRWPVVTIQFIFALNFFFGGLSKIRFTGIRWYSGENIRLTMLELCTLTYAPWAVRVASNRGLCWTIALGTLALELLFPLAVVSKRARWILVPVAFVAHLVRVKVYGFYFVGLPLLLLFIDWDRLVRWILPGTRGKALDAAR